MPAQLAIEAAHLAPDALPRWRTLLEFHWQERLERIIELSMAYYEAEEAGARAPARCCVRPSPSGVRSPRSRLR
jgi:hypothetical protein